MDILRAEPSKGSALFSGHARDCKRNAQRGHGERTYRKTYRIITERSRGALALAAATERYPARINKARPKVGGKILSADFCIDSCEFVISVCPLPCTESLLVQNSKKHLHFTRNCYIVTLHIFLLNPI